MYKKRKKRIGGVLIILTLFAIILGTVYYFISAYTIKNVYVEGNEYYTEQEIIDIVMSGPLGNNSLYLSLKYKNGGIRNIPFVDNIEVSFQTKDSIKILVHEKSLAGYIEFMDSFMYFDKDGYIVENSSVKMLDVPWIVGLQFEHVELGQKIPVENDEVFAKIMNLHNLLEEFELKADKIYFRPDMEIILFFGEVRVLLGDGSHLQEKIMVLPGFLERLTDEKGSLRMEMYSQEGDSVVFERDMSENN